MGLKILKHYPADGHLGVTLTEYADWKAAKRTNPEK